MYSVGHLLRQWIEVQNKQRPGKRYTQRMLAKDIGIDDKRMSRIMLGRVELTVPVAIELERITGISASALCMVDVDYRIWKWKAKKKHG